MIRIITSNATQMTGCANKEIQAKRNFLAHTYKIIKTEQLLFHLLYVELNSTLGCLDSIYCKIQTAGMVGNFSCLKITVQVGLVRLVESKSGIHTNV